MGAMSSSYNDRPAVASRAYDKNRDGFVIAGGAGVVVLEELEHARARGAKIYAEIAGYGLTSDGYDMVAPSGEGAVRCMRMALESVKMPIDYINPHATSTGIGDLKEIEAIREVFGAGENCPPIAATKSLTGLRKRQYRGTRSGLRRHEYRAQTPRRRAIAGCLVEFLRLRRHQRQHRFETCRCLRERRQAAAEA
jgi:hypothetical protein